MDRLFDNLEVSPFGPPCSSGVYAVCVSKYKSANGSIPKERILYIGSSRNIKKRILNPNHPYRICYDRFSGNYLIYTKSIRTDNYIQLEERLIKVYKPLLNKRDKR